MGRPKLRWSDVIRKYMNEKQVNIEEAQGPKTITLSPLQYESKQPVLSSQ